ncbi:protein MANBAL isoform X1 [Perca flavescens]|uniref:protein MANBAL isoform X1 n=1 Tax=Perca flavescens TaxID=8167 RepID=UPI00106EA2F6|nr:protein MANBAL isoform X1 [Perca flavescens]
MSAELDLSPPEVPEPTFLESLLRYGLFLGAIFQLICILAVIVPTSKGREQTVIRCTDYSPQYVAISSFTAACCHSALLYKHRRRLSPLMAKPLNR